MRALRRQSKFERTLSLFSFKRVNCKCQSSIGKTAYDVDIYFNTSVPESVNSNAPVPYNIMMEHMEQTNKSGSFQ